MKRMLIFCDINSKKVFKNLFLELRSEKFINFRSINLIVEWRKS